MINRRDLLVGGAATALAPRTRRLDASFAFNHCVAHLEGVAADANVIFTANLFKHLRPMMLVSIFGANKP